MDFSHLKQIAQRHGVRPSLVDLLYCEEADRLAVWILILTEAAD